MLRLESFEFDRAQHQGRRGMLKELKKFPVKAGRSRATSKYSSKCLLYFMRVSDGISLCSLSQAMVSISDRPITSFPLSLSKLLGSTRMCKQI